MEMTLQRLGLENYRPLIKGLVMPIGILTRSDDGSASGGAA